MNPEHTVHFLIESCYASLRPSEQKVADYILRHEGEVPGMSLAAIAERAQVSQPTVVRFAKALGMGSYKEFQYQMVGDKARSAGEQDVHAMYGYSVKATDTVESVPAKIVATTIRSLENTLKYLSGDSLKAAVDGILNARNIAIFGVENSMVTAKDLCTKLLYLGLSCHCFDDSYLQKIGASNLGKEDVAIGISYSGNSRDTVDVMKTARKSGAKTIVITNFQKSVIGKYADLVLCNSNEQLLYGNAIFSRTTQLAVVDMIYLGIILSDYSRFADKLDKSSRIIRDKAYD